MALKIENYEFKGLVVPSVYVRIDRIWGSSKEGWTALVGVYNIIVESIDTVTTQTVYDKIEEFNHSCSYVVDERGYTTMYLSMQTELGGVPC